MMNTTGEAPQARPLPPLDVSRIDVWRASLVRSEEEYADAWETLSLEECRRSTQFRFERDRRRHVIGHATLRSILACYTQELPSTLTFVYGAHGKPALLGYGDLAFNVSHSGDV